MVSYNPNITGQYNPVLQPGIFFIAQTDFIA